MKKKKVLFDEQPVASSSSAAKRARADEGEGDDEAGTRKRKTRAQKKKQKQASEIKTFIVTFSAGPQGFPESLGLERDPRKSGRHHVFVTSEGAFGEQQPRRFFAKEFQQESKQTPLSEAVVLERLISSPHAREHVPRSFAFGHFEGEQSNFLLVEEVPGRQIFPGDICDPRFVDAAVNALAAINIAGVRHLDIKPQHFFIEEREEGKFHVRLIDFGLALIVDPLTRDTIEILSHWTFRGNGLASLFQHFGDLANPACDFQSLCFMVAAVSEKVPFPFSVGEMGFPSLVFKARRLRSDALGPWMQRAKDVCALSFSGLQTGVLISELSDLLKTGEPQEALISPAGTVSLPQVKSGALTENSKKQAATSIEEVVRGVLANELADDKPLQAETIRESRRFLPTFFGNNTTEVDILCEVKLETSRVSSFLGKWRLNLDAPALELSASPFLHLVVEVAFMHPDSSTFPEVKMFEKFEQLNKKIDLLLQIQHGGKKVDPMELLVSPKVPNILAGVAVAFKEDANFLDIAKEVFSQNFFEFPFVFFLFINSRFFFHRTQLFENEFTILEYHTSLHSSMQKTTEKQQAAELKRLRKLLDQKDADLRQKDADIRQALQDLRRKDDDIRRKDEELREMRRFAQRKK